MINKSFTNRFGVQVFRSKTFQVGIAAAVLLFCFQNCGQPGQIDVSEKAAGSIGGLAVCEGVSCTLDPLTDKVAVTTILLALGDETNNQLVINGGSSQLIAETVVRYTTPAQNPRILVVRDHKTQGESPEDTDYVAKTLLARYKPTFLIEPDSGLTAKDIAGYDLVWFNNPGYPMSTEASFKALLGFKGGIVLQGDDMSQGVGFSMTPLTHLTNIDNGGRVTCDDGKTYEHDNNTGYQFRVSLDPSKMPSTTSNSLQFKYGNDIDLTSFAANDIDVMAVAYGGPEVCKQSRPTIVRYFKN